MVFFRSYFGVLLLLIFGLPGSAQVTEIISVESKIYDAMLNGLLSRNVPEISVEELSRTNNKVTLLDAREKQEYDVSHLNNAMFVGYNDFDVSIVDDVPKSTAIVIYCSVGYRSEKITERLMKAGYTNVSNLYGGIFEWKNAGHHVVDNSGKETTNVHAYDSVWGVWLNQGVKVY